MGVWRGAGTAGCRWEYLNTVGSNDGLFGFCTHVENMERFEEQVVSAMLSG